MGGIVMKGSKEAELVGAVLMYAVRCLGEGDLVALRNMKFGAREIEVLHDMNLMDLCRIESLRAHCLKVALNRQVYWPMVDHIRKRRKSEELVYSLVARDAPREMVQTLFGLNAREYSRLRRTLAVEPTVGRPPEPDEQSSYRLWEAWTRRVDPDDPDLLSAEEYLELFEETGVPMRAIWTLTRRWIESGMPGAAPARKADPQGGLP